MPEAAPACQSAPAAEALQNDPEAAAPEVAQDHRELPAQGQPAVTGCPICCGPSAAAVDRALHSGFPDLARIAGRYGFDTAVVKAHWDHTPAPQPPPVPVATKAVPEPMPHGLTLPETRADALALILRHGAALPATVSAWAERQYRAFAARWPGPPNATAAPILAYRRAIASADGPARLLACTALARAVAETELRDASVAAFREAAARLPVVNVAGPALGQAGIPFSASHYLGVLAARGVTLTVTEAMTLAARPASALNGIDRQVIAQHRAEIVSALVDVEVIGDAAA